MSKNLEELEKILNIKFKNKELLHRALVHRSYINEHPEIKHHNERLEFLGDAVIELIVTEYLFTHYDNPEGELTNWRAALVNAKMLSKVAQKLNFQDFIMLSRGEANDNNPKAKQYILADAFEAVTGAIYLDQGYNTAKDFILKNVVSELPYILQNELYIDAKSKFQELSQAKTGITPTYHVLEETGPDHNKHFKVGVYLNENLIATGEGSSKQEAQMDAARNALKIKNWK